MSAEAGAVPPPPAVPRATRRKWYGPTMKIVRRAHMYLGLILFPWIALYGISGVLFNHPEIGREIARRDVAAEELAAASAFRPWDPAAVARRVVEQLNAAGTATYRLDGDAAFDGWPILAAPSRDGGKHVLILDLGDGSASLAHHAAAADNGAAPFATTLEVPEYRMAAVEAQVKDALARLGVDAPAPLRAHPKVAPELRFRMRDDAGRAWNVTYHIGSGAIDGRRSDGDSGIPFVEVLEKLHTTHHYPVHGGVTWVWALLADLTGITLVLWALTGLAMWWQMKPTRVLGAVAISLALVGAAVLFTKTAAHVEFGNVGKDGP